MSEQVVEAVAEVIYPDVMSTWQDQWPLWEYADEEVAEWMRNLARRVLAVVNPECSSTCAPHLRQFCSEACESAATPTPPPDATPDPVGETSESEDR